MKLEDRWVSTSEIAEILGTTNRQLNSMRGEIFKPGKHYICKNPNTSQKGKRYLWDLKKCIEALKPDEN